MRDRFLRAIAETSVRNPTRVLTVALVSTALAAALIPGLQIDASHSAMFDHDKPYVRAYDAFLARFGSPNQLVVMVEGSDEQARRRVIDAALERLPSSGEGVCDPGGAANQAGCVAEVSGRLDLDRIGERALLYAPLDAIEGLVAQLEFGDFALEHVRGLTGLRTLFSTLADRVEDLTEDAVPTGAEVQEARDAMEVAAKFVRELTRRIREADRSEMSFEQAMFQRSGDAGVDTAGYLSSDDGSIKLALVRAVVDTDRPEHVLPFVQYVSRHMRQAAAEIDPRLKVTLTGLPAIIADEADVLWSDLLRTGVLATLGLFVILFIGFGSLGQTVLSLIPLALTLVWAMAFTRAAFGSLNLITAAVVPIILGLCIDFAVHLVSRYNEARHVGEPDEEAVVRAVTSVGPGLMTGAVTTSGAFIALVSSDFGGFRQMGIITGFGLVVALVLTLTVIPAMLCLPRLAFLRGRTTPPPVGALARIPDAVVRLRHVVLVGGVLLAAVALWTSREIPWSYDYADLLPKDTESADALRRLTNETDFSAEVAAVEVADLAEADALGGALAALPTVARVESVAHFMPGQQAEKLALLARLKSQTDTPLGERETVDVVAVRDAVQTLADALDDAAFDAQRAGSEHADLLDPPRAALVELLTAIDATPPGPASERLTLVQTALLDARDRAVRLLASHVDAQPMGVTDLLARLPVAMRSRLAHADGHLALYIYPSDPIGNRAYLTRFVAEVRTLAPQVTGLPVTHLESMDAIRTGFGEAALVALVLVMVLLLLDFRSPRYALLAVLPLGVGIAWTWGGITALGVPYNAGNVVALPLLLGIAVDSGVHVLHRFRQENEADVAAVVRHTGRAVMLSGLTTMAGFGALMVARHSGMSSFGVVLVVGISACLLSAVFFLPAWLHVVRRPKE